MCHLLEFKPKFLKLNLKCCLLLVDTEQVISKSLSKFSSAVLTFLYVDLWVPFQRCSLFFPFLLLSRILSCYDSIVAISFSLTFANSIFLYSHLGWVLTSKLISFPVTFPVSSSFKLRMSLSSNRSERTPLSDPALILFLWILQIELSSSPANSNLSHLSVYLPAPS